MNSEDIIGRKILKELPKEKLRNETSLLKDRSPISDFEYELFSLPKNEVIVKEKRMIHE